MSKIAVTKEQLRFIRMITMISDPQEAMDRILDLMKEEKLPGKYVIQLIDQAMKNFKEENQ